MSWLDALEFCEEQEGFLMEPKTEEQLHFVTSLAYVEEAFTGIQGWWAGLSDLGHEGQWVWQHSRDDAYISNWEDGCPDTHHHNTRDCAALVSITVEETRQYSAHYRDFACGASVHDFKVAAICQRGGESEVTTTPPPDTTTPVKQCPSGWTKYVTEDGVTKCLRYFSSTHTAIYAEDKCVQYSGHLASIHSEDEQKFIADKFGNNDYTWIGGIDNYHNGQWGWMDGSDFDYTKWLSGQPDGGQYYVEMSFKDDPLGPWRDIEYDHYLPYLCQIVL